MTRGLIIHKRTRRCRKKRNVTGVVASDERDAEMVIQPGKVIISTIQRGAAARGGLSSRSRGDQRAVLVSSRKARARDEAAVEKAPGTDDGVGPTSNTKARHRDESGGDGRGDVAGEAQKGRLRAPGVKDRDGTSAIGGRERPRRDGHDIVDASAEPKERRPPSLPEVEERDPTVAVSAPDHSVVIKADNERVRRFHRSYTARGRHVNKFEVAPARDGSPVVDGQARAVARRRNPSAVNQAKPTAVQDEDAVLDKVHADDLAVPADESRAHGELVEAANHDVLARGRARCVANARGPVRLAAAPRREQRSFSSPSRPRNEQRAPLGLRERRFRFCCFEEAAFLGIVLKPRNLASLRLGRLATPRSHSRESSFDIHRV